jgi:CheY-like chemotaxis protein
VTQRKRIEAELQKTQKLESLGILAGGIAHDFNNLIGVLYGSLDLALERTQETEVRRHLEMGLRSIERARGLTEQLLTFARGGQPITKPESLPPFLKDSVRFALSGSGVECRYAVPEDLWICEFDKNQMGQVIDNLVINAKQAMLDVGLIEVTARNVVIGSSSPVSLPAGSYVRLDIRDFGPGIAPSILSRIFDPFFTTKPKGQGLGLSTSYSILLRHRGKIEVNSAPGEGSTFSIFLPALPEARLTPSFIPVEPFVGQGRFIVMDDDLGMRETLGAMLTSLGFDVLTAATGEEALKIFEELRTRGETVAGLLFDLTVPGGMGGREAIGVVRRICKNVRAYVASGYAEEEVMARPQAYGFNASIRKPFLKSELIDMLRANVPALETEMKNAPPDV